MLKTFVLTKRSKYLFIIPFLFWNFSYGQITNINLQLAHKYFLDADLKHSEYEMDEPDNPTKVEMEGGVFKALFDGLMEVGSVGND